MKCGEMIHERDNDCDGQEGPACHESRMVLAGPCVVVSTSRLDLEAPALPATTGTLEFPALAADKGLGVLVRAHAKVPHRLAGVLGATQKNGVGALGRAQSQLVERKALAARGEDALPGGSGEAEGSNRQLGQLLHAVVVGDRADNDNRLRCLSTSSDAAAVLREVNQTGHGNRRAVDLAHKETAQDDLVEARVGPASQESVELWGRGAWGGRACQ